MDTLFPLEPLFPPGFAYTPGFITEGEEQHLVAGITGLHLHPFRFQGYEAKRKVASFGYDWSFEKGSLSRGADIPPQFLPLLEKIAGHLGVQPDAFAELLVTEYPADAVINWHRDAPPFGLIAGISLLTDCTFRLRPYDQQKQGRGSVLSFPVKRRSLYVMQGASRSEWQHSISAVKSLRYSITLRTLKDGM